MKSTAIRTPQEVFAHHAEALGAEDLEGIVSDYTDDARFITPDGVRRGKEGVREGFVKLLGDVPGAKWELPTQIGPRGSSLRAARPCRRRAPHASPTPVGGLAGPSARGARVR